MQPTTTAIDEPDVITIGQLEIRYLRDGTKTGPTAGTGSATGLFELTVQPGARVPPAHSHRDNEEIVYVLDGTLRYTVDRETRDLTAGETMHTPRGSVHAFSNPGDRPARALIMLTPDIGAQYFRDIAAVVLAPTGPDPARMAEVMTRYGLVLAQPPSAAGKPAAG